MIYLSVFVGGGLGSVLRALISRFFMSQGSLPVWGGTLLVNSIGSLIIICLSNYFESLEETRQYFFKVGVLGGLTTFSTFSYELVQLIKNSRFAEAAFVFILNIVFGIIVGVLLVK